MKTIKLIFQTLLSLLLIVGLVCSILLFSTSDFFKKEKLSSTLSDIYCADKILQLEYLSEDIEENDFYKKLSEAMPVQVALVVDVSGDNAKTCQDGAFEYIKENNVDKYAYNLLDALAESMGEGYTQTAIDKNIINPKQYVSYLNVQSERVTDTKENLLKETIVQKYKTELYKLVGEGCFCNLNVDQKTSFLYVLRSGKQGAQTQNRLYKLVENETEKLFDEHILNYFERLKGNNTEMNVVDSDEYTDLIKSSTYKFVEDEGLSLEFVNKEMADRILETGIRNGLYPKFEISLPSYEDTVSSLPEVAVSLISKLLNNKFTYVALGVSMFLIILIVLVGKKTSLYFLSFSLFISGLLVFVSKFYSSKLSDNVVSAMMNSKGTTYVLVRDLINRFMTGFSNYGIYLEITGLILLVLSVLLNRKKVS